MLPVLLGRSLIFFESQRAQLKRRLGTSVIRVSSLLNFFLRDKAGMYGQEHSRPTIKRWQIRIIRRHSQPLPRCQTVEMPVRVGRFFLKRPFQFRQCRGVIGHPKCNAGARRGTALQEFKLLLPVGVRFLEQSKPDPGDRPTAQHFRVLWLRLCGNVELFDSLCVSSKLGKSFAFQRSNIWQVSLKL